MVHNDGGRIDAIDRTRGLIMMLMALDHTLAFTHGRARIGEFWAVSFPSYDGFIPFALRAVTHLCAPGFFLTMGAALGLSAVTSAPRPPAGPGIVAPPRLIARGLLLIALQLTVVNIAWLLGGQSSDTAPGTGGDIWLYFGVLYGLGAAMILASPTLRWPPWTLALLAAVLLVGVAWAMPAPTEGNVGHAVWQRLLWIAGQTGVVFVRYPVLPWLSITFLGVVIGRTWTRPGTRVWLVVGGLLAIGLFISVRGTGGFGNLRPPEPGLIGFLNVVKYPPSIAFQLLTVGINLLLLALLPTSAILTGFGRSALFFYIVHLYLYGLVGRLLPSLDVLSALGVWVAGLFVLWPLCRSWRVFKASQPAASWVRLL